MADPSIATITIDMKKRCRECRRKGATGNGLCLRCITKHIQRGDYDERFRQIREQEQGKQ